MKSKHQFLFPFFIFFLQFAKLYNFVLTFTVDIFCLVNIFILKSGINIYSSVLMLCSSVDMVTTYEQCSGPWLCSGLCFFAQFNARFALWNYVCLFMCAVHGNRSRKVAVSACNLIPIVVSAV